MAYGRLLKPRFYIDTPNWLMSRGIASTEFVVKTGTDLIDHDSGFVDAELFDMKPNNQVVFSTKDSATTRADHVLIVIDTQGSSERKHYVAILNHNMKSAQAKFRVASSGSDITAADPTAIACTEVFNADDTSNIFTPDRNGTSIVTIDSETTDRYIAIQVEGSDSGAFDSSNDLKIGCVAVGEYWDMPHAPDLSVKRSVSFGTKMQTSVGGNEYSNAQWLENLSTGPQSGQPFRIEGSGTVGTTYYYRMGGKMQYDMSFSYVNDSDLLTSDMSSADASADVFVNDVWLRTGGSHIPFIFTPDSTSTTPGDYLFARFTHNNLDMTQVANNVWNVSLSVAETY